MKRLFVFLFALTFVYNSSNAVITIAKSMNSVLRAHIEDAGAKKYKLIISLLSDTKAIPEDPVLLLKFTDNTTLELKGKRTRNEKVDMPFGFNRHNDDATFIISQKVLDKIANGIIKFRINTQPKYYEKSWNNGKIGKKLYKDYQKSKF